MGELQAMRTEQVTWAELGCPKAIGAYRLHGASIRVKNVSLAGRRRLAQV